MEEYEFEAPKFVNFMTKNVSTPDVDKWFDARDGTPEPVNQQPVTNANPVKDLTIPQPFRFHTTHKKVPEPQNSPFVPLALKVKAFETNTPERFKKKPGKVTKRDLTKLTFPKSPYLRTRKRTHTRAIPTEEKELEELAKIRPFKAKKVPERILKGPQKSLKLAKMELTVPQSPAITKPKKISRPEPSPERIVKANPVPNLQKAFVPAIVHRVIEPTDFELPGESLTKMKKCEFEKKIKDDEIELIKKRDFKARPLPDSLDHPAALPEVVPRSLTEPIPFSLETDKRGVLHQNQLKEKLEHEMQKEMEMKSFVANPMPEGRPWVPDISEKRLVVPGNIVLNTEIRASKRQEFDHLLKLKEEEEIQAKENQLKMQMEAEQEMIRKLRKESVHHAQPVKSFAPVIVHPSTKPLTVPESPAIGKKRNKKV